MSKDLLFVLLVALLTWGGVFFYLLRLERMARDLERHVQDVDDEALTTETPRHRETVEDRE